MITLLLRAAGLEWSEQGDVWARVEAARPLPGDIPAESVTAMTGPLRRLLSIDATPSLAPEGSLTSEAPWITGLERQGRALGNAGREGQLSLGTRGVLARHVPFHWNRLGFSFRRQAIWARAARESILRSQLDQEAATNQKTLFICSKILLRGPVGALASFEGRALLRAAQPAVAGTCFPS